MKRQATEQDKCLQSQVFADKGCVFIIHKELSTLDHKKSTQEKVRQR